MFGATGVKTTFIPSTYHQSVHRQVDLDLVRMQFDICSKMVSQFTKQDTRMGNHSVMLDNCGERIPNLDR